MNRDIIYIFFPKSAGRYDNDLTVLEVCLKSLRRCNRTCSVQVFHNNTPESEMRRLVERYRIEAFEVKGDIQAEKINKRKIMTLGELKLEEGDRVLVCDIDLYFKKDPFRVFEKDFDVFATSRSYRYSQPIDTGIWGFRYNARSRAFLEFYIEQARSATWEPLIYWSKHYNLWEEWGFDQDFICVVFMIHWLRTKGRVDAEWVEDPEIIRTFRSMELPFSVKLHDASWRYAYTTWLGGKRVRKRRLYIFEKIYFSKIPVIHLRSAMHKDEQLKWLGLIEFNLFSWFPTCCYVLLHHFARWLFVRKKNGSQPVEGITEETGGE